MRFVSCCFVRLIVAAGVLGALLDAGVPAPARASAVVDASAASVAAAYPAPPGTSLVIATNGASAPDAMDRLERVGFRVAVALPPLLYYVIPPRFAAALPPGFEPAAPGPRSAPGAAELPGVEEAGPVQPSGLTETLPTPVDPFEGRPDLLPPQRPPSPSRVRGVPSRAAGAPGLYYGTRWGDTSEFMVGRVGVGVLFPESDGTLDPNQYDWTPVLRDSVIRSTITGLARWSTRAASHGIPLTFELELHLGLATRYEPINHPVAEEALWIADMLEPLLGHTGGASDLSYEMANDVRARLGTQWAYLIYAVQDATDPDGSFPDGYIAHSSLGGPWIVLPVNNLNSQSARLDYYVSHESTHMFWALDEYPANGAWWSCWLTSGYFANPNTNSSVPVPGYCQGGVEPVHCLMSGNYPDDVCPFTLGQIGWVDLDQNGRFDLFETRPTVVPDSTRYHALVGTTATLTGVALEAGLPNRNPYRSGAGDSISVATVDSIWMRVDGGPWSSLPAADGRFDTGREHFAGTLSGLSVGNHLVEWLAWNSNGLSGTTPAGSVLEVDPNPALAGVSGSAWSGLPRLVAGPSPSSGPISLGLIARPGARGRARIFDAEGRLVGASAIAVPPSGRARWTWDGRGGVTSRPASGIYFVTVEIDGERLTRRVVILR